MTPSTEHERTAVRAPEQSESRRAPPRRLPVDRSRAASTSWLAEATRERDEYLAALQRLKAEFDNYRKRVAREEQQLVARASERIVKQLLPMADDLERAVEAAVEHGETKVADGVRLVHRSIGRPARPRGARRGRHRRAASIRTPRRRCSRSPPTSPRAR